MNTTLQPRSTASGLLLALAGLAMLLAAYFNRDARIIVVGMQALGAFLFFLASFLQYRRSKTG
jgi:ABC-type transport system involved in cytochrome c biogenesis permease subunit